MVELDLNNYETLLAEAGRFHGDICPGIQIGTRMTMCGMKRLGLSDPFGADRKKLMVFVKIDRCATVLDGRETEVEGKTSCKPCFGQNNYYRILVASNDAALP
jgi:formylmethanofuran dehydrogenase subunit E